MGPLPAAMRAPPASQVHAIFEPKQDSTAHDIVIVDDEDAEVRLGKLAAMLGLTRVGLIIGHPAREYCGMSTERALLRPALDTGQPGRCIPPRLPSPTRVSPCLYTVTPSPSTSCCSPRACMPRPCKCAVTRSIGPNHSMATNGVCLA